MSLTSKLSTVLVRYTGKSGKTTPSNSLAPPESAQSSRPSSSGRYTPGIFTVASENLRRWQNFANGGARAADEELERHAYEEYALRRQRAKVEDFVHAISRDSLSAPPLPSVAPGRRPERVQQVTVSAAQF